MQNGYQTARVSARLGTILVYNKVAVIQALELRLRRCIVSSILWRTTYSLILSPACPVFNSLRSPSSTDQPESAQDTNAYSLELTMPPYSPDKITPGNLSSVGPRSVGDRSTAIDISADPSVDTSRVESPDTPLEWSNVRGGGSTELGWPPSLPPPSRTDITRKHNPMLMGIPQNQGSIAPSGETTSALFTSGETVNSTEGVSSPAQELLNQEHEEEETFLFESSASAPNVCTSIKPPGAAQVTIANAVIARAKREADGFHSRSPAVLNERRPPTTTAQAPRPPFNFDSAQAPSSGMSGVGVAVPRGFSDAR